MEQRATFIDGLDEQNTLLTEIATHNVICLTTTSSVGEAASLMRQRRISSIVVTDKPGHPAGIITERNILQAMRNSCPHETALEGIMSSPVISVPLSTAILDAYQLCLKQGIRHLVIVDEYGALAGVVSETDFRLHLNLTALAGRRRLSTITRRAAIVLPPSAKLQQAINMMLTQCKSCVVAVEDKKPVGIITERDVVRFYSDDASYDDIKLGEVMASPVHTIPNDATTSQVAKEMLAHKLRHLVLVDTAGHMAGLVSEHNLTQALETGLMEEREGIEERFLRTLINTIPDLVWLKDTNGIYLACNARFEQLYGAREAEIVGKTDYDFVDRKLADSFREHDLKAVEANESSINEEWLHFAANGYRGLFETIKTPMYDRNQKLIGILGVARDITERKRAAKELHEKEERLALATLHNGVGIWDWNLTTQEMVWDDSMYALYHIHREDFTGSEEAWRTALHPDDLERGDREVEEAIAGTKPFDTEFRVVWPNGEIRHIRAVAKVFRDEKGTPLRMLGTNVDITERKQLEEKLEQSERTLHNIYDSVSDCIEIISMDGIILDMNRAGCERQGYMREEILGKKLSEFASPTFAPKVAENIARIKENGQATFESERLHKNGAAIPIEVSSRLIELDGQPVFLGISRDITQRKRNEAITASRWHLTQFALKHSLDELLEETLNEAEKLTGSVIGFYHFVEDDQVSLTLQNWSKRTKTEFCKAEGKGLHYPLDEAGVWVDCVRERKPVIHNDYASLSHRKGLPEGHAAVIREMVVPVYRGDKITAILGVGNKPANYTEQDLEVVTLLADVAWDIAERKRSEQQLEEYRRRLEGQVAEESTKFRALVEQSLVGIYIIQEGAFRYINPGMADIFGYDSPNDIVGKIDMLQLVSPEDHAKVSTNLLRRLNDETGAMRYSMNCIKRDGTPIVVEVHGSKIDFQGKPAVIGTVVDITEEKRSQEELARLADEKAAELMRKENVYSAIFRQSDNGIELIDPDTLQFVEVNDAVCRMLGYSREEMLGMHLMDTQAKMSEEQLRASTVELPVNNSVRFENQHRCKDGTILDVEVTAGMQELGGRRLIVAVWNDITERKRAEEGLRITASVFDTSQEAIVITDAYNIITDVNPAFSRITGYSRKEVLGQNPDLLSSGRHDKEFYTAMWESLQQKDSWRGEIWNRRKNGEIYAEMLSISVIRDKEGKVLRHVAVFSDISHIKAHEAELSRVAHYDALTGIPNRVLLADRMKQALARTRRERNMMAVCYIDLDAFKPINDSMGHDAGDHVLVEISRRIEKTIRGGDTVARLGGDEFVILLLGLKQAKECVITLKRLLHEIALPIDIEGKAAKVGASIGVSIYPQDDQDADTLLRHADQAMYLAKQAGKHCFHIYDPTQDRRARDYNEFMQAIRHALVEKQFELYYQPKIDLKSKRLLGAEALIRWNHPERGLLSPFEFLPTIENSDLDIDIGEWVVGNALEQLDHWQRAGLDIEISVNISAYHLEFPGFVEMLRHQLASYPQLPAGRLQIEVLETTALEDVTVVNGIIKSCRELGVGFALDDFGTGYSSLSYLSQLPVDALKIDQSFVRDMLEDKGDMAIVQGIIALAQAFNLQIVAEGIETPEHYKALLELGCEVGQGYGIARPMPAHQLEEWNPE